MEGRVEAVIVLGVIDKTIVQYGFWEVVAFDNPCVVIVVCVCLDVLVMFPGLWIDVPMLMFSKGGHVFSRNYFTLK